MVQCLRCGATNRDTARFCAHCSGPLIPTTPPAAAFGQICPNCQTGNSSTARFCKGCGQSLPIAASGFTPTPTPVQPYPSAPSFGSRVTGLLPPKSYVAGRYMILQKVGQGGMGAVYEAVDTRLGQHCAIKEMSSANLLTMAERQVAIANFEQEAEMLAKLNHPNLPRVTDHFNEGGRHYMVMEFIEGETLDKRLEIGQVLPETEVQNVAEQLTIVLEYLHSQSPPIIFRDLKPGNIMVQPDGRVKLIDFGIMRFFKPGKKQDTQLLGTPGYAAPEAYSGQTDARSDIFSLGITLYCLLTGKEPPQDISNFQPLAELSAYSSDLSQVIMTAIKVKPGERWASATKMRQALQSISIPGQGQVGTGTKFMSGQSGSGQPGGRIRGMTQRLTQSIALRVKQMSNTQLAAMAIALVVGIGVLTWLVGPWLAENLPWLWDFLPLYYAAGLFAYAVSNRRGAVALVHVPVHLIVAGLTWVNFSFVPHLLAGLVGAGGMEVALSGTGGRQNRIWFYMAAPALGVALAMGVLALTGQGFFDVKEVVGAGLVGAMAYVAGEVVWGVREGV